MNKTEKMNFKVSTGLKNIIGQELITNEVVAVFELVKNSFDANAKNITIDFDLKKKQICILDDGIGMTKDDIANKWLFVAYSEKKNAEGPNGRVYVGAKGIGRFACDRLGSEIKIVTKTESEKKYNTLEVTWGEFEKNTLDKFDNIPVFYSKLDSYEHIKAFGTELLITNLRDDWDKDRLMRLKKSLEKLVNPFKNDIGIKIKFNVISDKPELIQLSSFIENTIFEALKEKTAVLNAEFSHDIQVSLKDRGEDIFKISKSHNDTGLDGIKMCIYYLNPSAKNNFTKHMGIRAKDYASILIYKNDFRIYPYGEIDYDTFGLDSRKTQGYNRYLGNREIIGYISIQDRDNRFIEVSSRDRGFIENGYFQLLMKIYMEFVHRPLERYVNLIKWGYDEKNQQEIMLSDLDDIKKEKLLPVFLDKTYDVVLNEDLLKRKAPKIEDVLANAIQEDHLSSQDAKSIMKKTKVALDDAKTSLAKQEKQNKEQVEMIAGLKNQNHLLKNLTQDEITLQAEVTHHISKMANEIDSCISNIVDITGKNKEVLNEVAKIKMISDRMRVFNQIILKGNFESKGKIAINLYDYFHFYFENSSYIQSLSKTKTIHIHEGDGFSLQKWDMNADVYDISIIIDNLLSNAIDYDAKVIDIAFEKNQIVFFSDTPFIAEQNMEKIFELGFSTKDGGTGIGLYQIRKLLKKYGFEIVAKNVEHGVQFIMKEGSYEK